MKLKLPLSLFTVAVLFCASTALAQNGSLDQAFATNGLLSFKTKLGNDQAHCIAQQADGKILLGGWANKDNQKLAVIIRTNTSGVLDNTFGTGGIAYVADPNGLANVINSIVPLADGKLLIAGTRGATSPRIFVRRLNSDGTVDASFGSSGNGMFSNNFGETGNHGCAGIALQSDGKIILAGTTGSSIVGMRVARLTTAGALDNTFATSGSVKISFGSSTARAADVKVLSDDKIVVAGQTGASATGALARLSAAGVLDNSFDSDGKQTFSVSGYQDIFFTGVDVQSDGAIVLTGTGFDNTAAINKVLVARYTSAGALDATFNTTGYRFHDINGTGLSSLGYDIAVQSDGVISVAASNDYRAAVCRYNSNGTSLSTFGNAGVLNFFGNTFGRDEPRQLLLSGQSIYCAIARVNVSGDADNFALYSRVWGGSFFSTTTRYYNLGESINDEAQMVRLLSDGSMLIAGNVGNANGNTSGIIKVSAGGVVTTPFSGADGVLQNRKVFDIAVEPNGSSFLSLMNDGIYAYFTSNGNLNPRFTNVFNNPDPFTGLPSGVIFPIEYKTVLPQADGSIWVFGSEPSDPLGSVGYYKLIKLSTTGSIALNTNIAFGTNNGNAVKMIQQADGKLLLLCREDGSGTNGDMSNWVIMRRNTNGSADNTFGTNGKVTTNITIAGNDYDNVAFGIEVDANGKILVCGSFSSSSEPSKAVIARYTSAGALDGTFASSSAIAGIYMHPDVLFEQANDIKVLSNGTIATGGVGYYSVGNVLNLSGVVALLTDGGVLSTNFGDGTPQTGLAVLPLVDRINPVNALAIQNSGNIIAVGRGSLAAASLLNSSSVLPLRLLQFNGDVSNHHTANLQWQTINEVNTSRFEIERSVDARLFSKIGNVQAANTNGTHRYQFFDKNISGTLYYRLKMVDADGKYTYSSIVKIEVQNTLPTIRLYPNPAKDILVISGGQTGGLVKIVDINGVVLKQEVIRTQSQTIHIHSLPAGIYVLEYEEKLQVKQIKFVKQ